MNIIPTEIQFDLNLIEEFFFFLIGVDRDTLVDREQYQYKQWTI